MSLKKIRVKLSYSGTVFGSVAIRLFLVSAQWNILMFQSDTVGELVVNQLSDVNLQENRGCRVCHQGVTVHKSVLAFFISRFLNKIETVAMAAVTKMKVALCICDILRSELNTKE
jgi:hypothetical protein